MMSDFRWPPKNTFLKFSSFICDVDSVEGIDEDMLHESKDGASMNDRGVAAELAFGAHLHEHIRHIIAKEQGKKPGEYAPLHMKSHPNKQGISPEQAHKDIGKKLGKAVHTEINDAAGRAAQTRAHEIIAHLKEHHPDIHKKLMKGEITHDVAWTSKPDDHKSYTGKEDPAHVGGADVMIGFHDKSGKLVHAHGESLKYQNKGPMKAATMGQTQVEEKLGMKPGSLTKHQKSYTRDIEDEFNAASGKDSKFLEKYGSETKDGSKKITSIVHMKDAFRKLDTEGHPVGARLLELQRRRDHDGAQEIANHLSSMSHEDRNNAILDAVAPKHAYDTHHTTIRPDGTVHSVDLREKLHQHLKGRATTVVHEGNFVHVKELHADGSHGPTIMKISHGDRRGVSNKLNITAHIGDHIQKHLGQI